MPEYCAVKKNLIVIIIFFSSQFFAQNNWFPMHTDNYWRTIYHYEDWGNGDCIIEVNTITTTDTLTINDKLYYKILENDNLVWRYDKDDNILYSYFNNNEFVYMDFNLAEGNCFFQRPHFSSSFREVRVTDGWYFIAGSTRYCKGFEYRIEDCDYYELFADNIGPILKGGSCEYHGGCAFQTYTISANIFSDSALVHYRANINPKVYNLSIYSSQSSTTIADTVEIRARANISCESMFGTQYFSYVQEAKIEYFYSNGSDTTATYWKNLINVEGFNWAIYVSLDPDYFCNGYDVYYRFKIIDKDFYPTTYYYPTGGVFNKVSYSPTVAVEDKNTVEEFSLSQNYPNPFNSSTTFSISVSREAYVKLV